MVDAFGYDSKSLREVIQDLRHIADSYPAMLDKPVWVDVGGLVLVPIKTVGIVPGARWQPERDARTVIRTHRS